MRKSLLALVTGLFCLVLVSSLFITTGAKQPSSARSYVTTPTASPTPYRSPIAEPAPANQTADPQVEMTAEDEVDAMLGTVDWDCDGIPNRSDNCIYVFNPEQKDANGDGIGDSCDPEKVSPSLRDSRCDKDRDGVPDLRDNCPWACNPDQADTDKNEIGDACDPHFPKSSQGLRVCRKPRAVPDSLKK